MDSKLTLKLNEEIIKKAKVYAASQRKSLSRIIESYLQSLVLKKKSHRNKDLEISPFVKSMKKGIRVPSDLDFKMEYSRFITEKHG
jgi:hypothetical protein